MPVSVKYIACPFSPAIDMGPNKPLPPSGSAKGSGTGGTTGGTTLGAACTDIHAIGTPGPEGTGHSPNGTEPADHELALETLMASPSGLLDVRRRVASFSAQCGSLWQTHAVTDALYSPPEVPSPVGEGSDGGRDLADVASGSEASASGQGRGLVGRLLAASRADARRYDLVSMYRYWGEPLSGIHQRSAAHAAGKFTGPHLADDGQGLSEIAAHRTGWLAVNISQRVGHTRSHRRTPVPCLARLYSDVDGFSTAGAWHCALTELAQDLYLKDLTTFIPRQEVQPRTATHIQWPTLCAPSLMRLEHGLGVPVMTVNGRPVAVGFFDVTEGSYLLVETRLFLSWLQQQIGGGAAAWPRQSLDAVLTPPLADWVLDCRRTGAPDDRRLAGLWLSHLVHGSAIGHVHPDGIAAHLADELGLLALTGFRMIDDQTHESLDVNRQAGLSSRLPSGWLALLEGLSTLQDHIRYGDHRTTLLAPAGLERAYLNSLLRNTTCLMLGLHEPAEIAQFDLALRAWREGHNRGFNDDSVNFSLVRHLEWVAATQDGYKSKRCKALRILTAELAARAQASEGDFLFVLDEHSRATGVV